MKNFLLTTLLFVSFIGMVHATPNLNFTDTYTGFATNLPNSSIQAETDWINGVLGVDASTAKIDNLSLSSWTYLVNDIWSITIPEFADYFAVKTGNIFGTNNDFFLFENNVDRNYATIALTDIGIAASNVLKISHITYQTAQVPEPSGIILVLLGLVGIVFAMRLRKQPIPQI